MNPARKIDINGQKIACYESEGKGTTLFFIHSNSTSAEMFDRQFQGHLGKKYRLVGIDLPGHGRSDAATNPKKIYSLPGYAGIVIKASKILNAENAIFIGWSLGGHILLEASENLRKASGLVIFGTPPLGKPPEMESAFSMGPSMRNIFKQELNDREILEWANFQLGQDEDFEASVCLGEAIKRTKDEARVFIGESLKNLEYRDELEAIRKLDVPLAILHGEKDRCINFNYLKMIKSPMLWRNEIQVISGAGHFPQWEESEAFNTLVEEFIEDVDRYWEKLLP